jgi:hypothetical protein
MKLTLAQITLIEHALSEHAALCQSRAYHASNKTFWEGEAQESARLYGLFMDALNVEVESVQLEPSADNATPAISPEAAEPNTVRPVATPPLLNAIDQCGDSQAARDLLRNARPADRRAVAKFLNIPANDLLDVITRRFAA